MKTSLVIWVDPADCDPPHEVRKQERLYPLIEEFSSKGFDKSKPALIGYVLKGRIQLLSGTHRHKSAEITGIKIPVTLWRGDDIDQNWGQLEEWRRVMEDIPVSKLESVDIEQFRTSGAIIG